MTTARGSFFERQALRDRHRLLARRDTITARNDVETRLARKQPRQPFQRVFLQAIATLAAGKRVRKPTLPRRAAVEEVHTRPFDTLR